MNICKKCGNQIDENLRFCPFCGENLEENQSDNAELLQENTVTHDNTANTDVIETANSKNEIDSFSEATNDTEVNKTSQKKKRKIKEKQKEITEKIKKNGKESAANFIIKRGISYLLTVLLSAGTVLWAQWNFEDGFVDYYKDAYTPVSQELAVINEFIEYAKSENNSPEDIVRVYNDNKLYDRTYAVMNFTVSYSSDNKDIMRYHSAFTDYMNEVLDLSTLLYVKNKYQKDNDTDIYVTETKLQLKYDIFKDIEDDIFLENNLK